MSDTPSSIADSINIPQTNGLRIETIPWELEKIYDYEAGGHHPVHLRDTLNSRYRVIHKLGSGGYANVWLCRDLEPATPAYYALKILMAEYSTADCPESRISELLINRCGREAAAAHLSIPVDQFKIDGPNGTHLAFVHPLLGPRASRLPHLARVGDPGPALRKLCFDAVQAMATLHAQGICHGGTYLLEPVLTETLHFSADNNDTRLSTFQHPGTCARYRRPL
jgi:hypothetical protein